MKFPAVAVCLIFACALSACKSQSSDTWQRGKRYRWVAPSTGSNVGRWVEVPDGSKPRKSKEKRKKKAERAAAPKREKPEGERPADLTPAPPADRFR